jgi:Flp pilus assembly protein TadG
MTRRNERGSASLEAAIGVPAFALFVALIILGGRTATTHQALESAAADAARSASLARTADAAAEAAREAAHTSIANQDLSCVDVDVTVDTDAFTQAVGRDSTVGVTIACRLDLSDLSIPGVPGTRILRATMTSPLDTWRERTP